MTLFTPARQQRMVDELQQFPNACALRCSWKSEDWLRGQDINTLPLVQYIDEDFRTLGQVLGYEFRVRRSRSPIQLLYCVTSAAAKQSRAAGPWTHCMLLPAMPGRLLSHMAVADAANDVVLADTLSKDKRRSLDCSVETSSQLREIDLAKKPVSLDEPCRIWLRQPFTAPLRNGQLVMRLFGQDDRPFASIPFLDSGSLIDK
jgi:hypothetical protein